MPIRPSKDVVQKIVELPTPFAEEVGKFVDSRGSTFRAEVMRALRRHMDNPPPLPAPDPPLPPEAEPAPKKKSKKTGD